VDNEDKVIEVQTEFNNSSDENHICNLVDTYFEQIDFPEDTNQFLNDLYQQVKPQLQIIPLTE
jgi:hypothetical protein